MKTKYFNTWKFQQALSHMDSNPYESKIKFEQYLKEYPKDYSAYPYYASTLIILGELHNAELILDYVEQLSIDDIYFKKDTDKYKRLKKNILSNRIKILSYQEKYEELYELCQNNLEDIKTYSMKPVYFYSRKKTGRIVNEIRETNSYQFRQIVSYQEEDLLENLQIHLSIYNQDINNPNKNIFIENFPIKEIINEIKKYLPSDKRLLYGYFENHYIFKYPNCGKENNKQTDYFKVICFHNTSDIITIYPTTNGQFLPYIDLSYLVHESKNVPKVKRLSQIDKFNQRYQQK